MIYWFGIQFWQKATLNMSLTLNIQTGRMKDCLSWDIVMSTVAASWKNRVMVAVAVCTPIATSFLCFVRWGIRHSARTFQKHGRGGTHWFLHQDSRKDTG